MASEIRRRIRREVLPHGPIECLARSRLQRIPVGNVREVCDAHGGSILLADLIVYYVAQIGEISAPTVKNAVNREVAVGLIETERAKGKGSPILIRSKGNKP